MLREPKQDGKCVPTPGRLSDRQDRFKIQKLEERIAPRNCHTNPHGKLVGCGKPGSGGEK